MIFGFTFRRVIPMVPVNGTLCGTTTSGGKYDRGTVFSISTTGHERMLYSFSAGGGKRPRAALLELVGTLYSTAHGATYNKHGNVFSIRP